MKKILYLSLFVIIFTVGCTEEPEPIADSDNINVTSQKWKDKTIHTFGDSITWYDGNEYTDYHKESGNIAVGYQSYIRGELGARVNNYGKGGATLVEIADIVKEQTFSEADGVILTGGINDWGEQVPLGRLEFKNSTFDIETSYGSLQSSIEYILDESMGVPVYLMTPIPGAFKEDSKEPMAGEKLPIEYRDMFLDVGELYDLPVLDLYELTGFEEDYNKWYQDKGELEDRFIHIGDDGYEVIAEHLVPFLIEK